MKSQLPSSKLLLVITIGALLNFLVLFCVLSVNGFFAQFIFNSTFNHIIEIYVFKLMTFFQLFMDMFLLKNYFMLIISLLLFGVVFGIHIHKNYKSYIASIIVFVTSLLLFLNGLVLLFSITISFDSYISNTFFLSCCLSVLLSKYISLEKWTTLLSSSDFSLTTSDTHGTASFLSSFETNRLLNHTNKGFILDGKHKRLSEKSSFQNIAVFAPTGVGKTQSFVIPNILQQHDQSIVVTDPSGEILQTTKSELKRKGYEILVIDPFSLAPEQCFNPLLSIESISDAKRVAKTLSYQIQSKSDPYWEIATSNYVSAALLLCRDFCLHYKDQSYLTFDSLKKILVKSEEELLLLLNEEAIVSSETNIEFRAAITGSEELINTIRNISLSSISLFSDEQFKKITSKQTFQISSLRHKKTAIFICIPEHKIRYSSAFLSLFYSQLFDELFEVLGMPVFVYLEEFGNIGRIPNFSSIITTNRKRDIAISLILQDIEQVENNYKGELNTILSGGCVTKLFYSSLSSKSAQFAADLIGKKNQETSSKTNQSEEFRSSTSESETARNLLNIDEIRRLNSNEGIIIHGNLQPIKSKIVPAYKQAKLQKMMG